MKTSFRQWVKEGEPFIWLTGGAVAISMIMVFAILALIAVKGLAHFWPHPVYEYDYTNKSGQIETVMGEVRSKESVASSRIIQSGIDLPEDTGEFITRYLLKVGNRDVQSRDFKNIIEELVAERRKPDSVMVLERVEFGNFYGYLKSVSENDQVVASDDAALAELQVRLDRVLDLRSDIKSIQKDDIGSINARIERQRLRERKLELNNDSNEAAMAEIKLARAELDVEYQAVTTELNKLNELAARDSITLMTASGQEVNLPLATIVHAFQPNQFNVLDKVGFFFKSFAAFVFGEPREANTEGGVFPAIFGTVLMVIIMAMMVTPLGVVAAIYLREYAHQGPVVQAIRIAVNNLAGVPSIVYGVFGLGFFIYFLGGNLDRLFFEARLPAPTFGTPGLFWASLTLALLTLPVVIVSTEEGLARIPRAVREGSLALGATKFETLWRTIIPMSSPAIMTGLILAVARAAGEVAPLMLVGVVKLAPSLALDGNAPYLHLDRKFMHLGFHIYDVGFQSPNVEAARPLVYATALLLVIVIVLLNLAAIYIRNRLREKYRALQH